MRCKAGVLIMLIKQTPVYCRLLWIPDDGDVMTDTGERRRQEEVRLVRSIFTDWRVQTERRSENSSRGKQGNLFQKTLQGVSAKSHTILSAVNVCVALVSHHRTKYLKTSGQIFLKQLKSTETVQSCETECQRIQHHLFFF